MKIHFSESKYWSKLPKDFKAKYKIEIQNSFDEVIKLLPFGAKNTNFFVQPRTYALIDSTGDNARTHNSEFIELAFDPTRNDKGLSVILKGVKPSVFHEMNHAARYNIPIYHKTFIDSCIMEGLATVFSRDYAHEKAPWAVYPKNVNEWIVEIISKNDLFNWTYYSFDNPDGRKWIAYKVGTYIVDRAIKKSGKTVIELTKMECSEIAELADLKLDGYTGLI